MDVSLAVVTGSSRGIGAGIVTAAQQAGATVATCSRSSSASPNHLAADLSDPTAWPVVAGWLERLVDELSPSKLTFVHNAATLTPIGFAGEVDAAAYTSNVLLNSAAPQVIGDAVVRTALQANLPTALVQLSSGAGKNPYTGWTSYCASKAAVDMWIRTLGLEQAERENTVRALSISPGVVATEMQAEIRASDETAFPGVERFRGLHHDGQLADPVEVGAKIWSISQQTDWESGTVGDLSLLAS